MSTHNRDVIQTWAGVGWSDKPFFGQIDFRGEMGNMNKSEGRCRSGGEVAFQTQGSTCADPEAAKSMLEKIIGVHSGWRTEE